MTPGDEIIRNTKFGGVYFNLKNQYKISLNIVKKKFFLEFMVPIRTYQIIEIIVLYFVKKKILK